MPQQRSEGPLSCQVFILELFNWERLNNKEGVPREACGKTNTGTMYFKILIISKVVRNIPLEY